ncbi:ATPase family associated with various cellular activities (AAA) [Rhizobium sp. RU20A]|uniref:ATP-binding protein n=1 Tax=Rhizobium sp. RU20A TaxID=1907412 RepID=UPI00095590B6|nr:ATP-binding protein [Rhizobium sp. RU20A]SIR21260.1 ATPase family associated with various cellular activities (AAA) [Rhizobium sp. RU20A]
METLTDRVTRHLLTVLRHRALMATFHRAQKAGLLTATALRGHPASQTAFRATDEARRILSGTPARDREIIARLLRTKGAQRHQRDTPFDFTISAPDGAVNGTSDGAADPATCAIGEIDFRYIATCLTAQLPAANPVHVAVALLLARAIGTSFANREALTAVLRAPAPFLLIKAPVKRFETCLAAMLEEGLILPFKPALDDVLRNTPLSGRFRQSAETGQRRLRTLSGKTVASVEETMVRRHLRQALTDEPCPIILVDETRAPLTPVVTATADMIAECPGFDHAMIAELLQACCGTPPSHSLTLMEAMGFEPDRLSLDDIALAIRPDRGPEQTLSVMAMLAARHDGEDSETEKAGSEDGQPSDTGRQTSKARQKAKSKGHEIEIIEPVTLRPETIAKGSVSDKGRPAETRDSRDRTLLVETLSGYGAARDWAFDLKADLSLWRDGQLTWDAMSTRLLLSGPPGTGKTLFARALCNTLQVPLLATSVADWLEPGFLGDVLQRMSGAFAFAAEKAPAILFIDEIDNIGLRHASGASRNYDDYWTSMINRMLELLDGASRREGVIVVGATNLPERIDPALLRSGRLETHIPISLPDVDALIGILASHLGPDLERVLASAPPPRVATRLKPPPAINAQPLRRSRRPSTAPDTDRDTTSDTDSDTGSNTQATKGPRHEDR